MIFLGILMSNKIVNGYENWSEEVRTVAHSIISEYNLLGKTEVSRGDCLIPYGTLRDRLELTDHITGNNSSDLALYHEFMDFVYSLRNESVPKQKQLNNRIEPKYNCPRVFRTSAREEDAHVSSCTEIGAASKIMSQVKPILDRRD